jgi:hypothetical protein
LIEKIAGKPFPAYRRNTFPCSGRRVAFSEYGMQPTQLPLQQKRKSLHDLADEDVELAVALFADFGDFVGTRFIARHRGTASGRGIAGREIDDDSQVLSAAGEFQNGVGKSSLGPKHSAVRLGKIHDELAFEINAFTGQTAIREIAHVAGRDETAHRHFAGQIHFPVAAAGRGSKQVIGRAR